MNTDTKKFFLYVRKSTDDLSRQVRSIEDQKAELRELAKREGLEVVEVFEEKQTAKVPGRPIFNDMVNRIEKGEANGILAWHPDRLARNSLDGGRVIYLLDIANIVYLRFPTFLFENTAHGKLMLAFAFGMSKYYVDNLSENIKRGQRQKLKNGIWPMVAPVGYLNDKLTKTIYIDPERGPLIAKAFELYASGEYTLDRISSVMADLGLVTRYGEPLIRAQWHRVLQNPIYIGIIRYAGEQHEGVHEPLVSTQVFEKVQAVFGRKSKPKTPKLKPYLYRGMFRCMSCGCFITSETQKGHNYLHCTKRVVRDCPEPFVREEKVAEQITLRLNELAVPTDLTDWLLRELEDDEATDTKSRTEALDAVRQQVQQLTTKQERLMEAYLDQSISLEEYKPTKNRLVEEKQLLKEKLATLEKNNGNWFEPAKRFVKALQEASLGAESGTDIEKRDLLKKIGSNLTISNRHLSVVPRKEWQLVVDQGVFAQRQTAALSSSAAVVGEIHHYAKQRGSCDSNWWNEVVAYLSCGLLYGREVERPEWFGQERRHEYRPRMGARPAVKRGEVERRLLEGKTVGEIAREMGMTGRQVRGHCRLIYKQHGVKKWHEFMEKNGKECPGMRESVYRLKMRGWSLAKIAEELEIRREKVNGYVFRLRRAGRLVGEKRNACYVTSVA